MSRSGGAPKATRGRLVRLRSVSRQRVREFTRVDRDRLQRQVCGVRLLGSERAVAVAAQHRHVPAEIADRHEIERSIGVHVADLDEEREVGGGMALLGGEGSAA